MFDPILPVRTDDDVLALAVGVLQLDGGDPPPDSPGAAAPRERLTWVLLLDDEQRPLPLIVPIDGVPVDPDPEHVARFADAVRQLIDAADAATAVVMWERPGPSAIRLQEADWAEAIDAAGLPLRAQVLATDDGVRLLDPAFEAITAA